MVGASFEVRTAGGRGEGRGAQESGGNDGKVELHFGFWNGEFKVGSLEMVLKGWIWI